MALSRLRRSSRTLNPILLDVPICLCGIFYVGVLLNCQSQKPFNSRSQIEEGNHLFSIRVRGFPIKCTTRLVHRRRAYNEEQVTLTEIIEMCIQKIK